MPAWPPCKSHQSKQNRGCHQAWFHNLTKACMHLPCRQRSKAHLMQTATHWPQFYIFPCLNFPLCKMQLQGIQDNNYLFNARHRTLEGEKRCFPSMPGNVPRLGWIPWESGAMTWLLHKQTVARDAGWGIAWVRLSLITPFPLNVGSKAPLLLFLEKQESSLLFGVFSCRHKHIDFLGLFNCGNNSKLCQQWPY